MRKIQLHACVLTVVLGLALIAAKSGKPLSLTGRPDTTFEAIPMELAGWVGQDMQFAKTTYDLLPTCSLLLRYYEHESVYAPIELAIVYGTDLGDFHQPEMCLEGQGLRSVYKGKVLIRDTDGSSFEGVKLIAESEDYHRHAFVFWFAGSETTSTFLGTYKLKIFMNRLLARKVQPSALVRLSTEVTDSDDEAVEQLVRFAEDFLPYFRKEFAAKRS